MKKRIWSKKEDSISVAQMNTGGRSHRYTKGGSLDSRSSHEHMMNMQQQQQQQPMFLLPTWQEQSAPDEPAIKGNQLTDSSASTDTVQCFILNSHIQVLINNPEVGLGLARGTSTTRTTAPNTPRDRIIKVTIIKAKWSPFGNFSYTESHRVPIITTTTATI